MKRRSLLLLVATLFVPIPSALPQQSSKPDLLLLNAADSLHFGHVVG